MESTPPSLSPEPRVNIRVVSSDNPDGITFKIKRRSTLKKLFDNVKQLFAIDPPSKPILKFDGEVLTEDDTPEALGMSDDDVIDLSIVGEEQKDKASETTDHIDIRVIDQGGHEIFFRIKPTTNLGKMMNAYCEKMGCAADSVRFLFNGQRIQTTQQPKLLGMESGDVIDVVIAQVGGAMKQ